jgi:DNA-directed RNA polymerase subunit RPC12/RpoP
MRIVDSLTKMTECPNCGSKKLYGVYDHINHRTGGVCGDCGETFEERCSPLVVISTKENKEKEREELLMDARDLLHDLPLFARTANELDTLTQITNIFDKIITLLEKE